MTDIAQPDRGAFCFAELNTADLEGSRRFYCELFGWTAVDVPAAAGNYVLFQLGGQDVAGVRRAGGGTHRWVSYVFVESIADTVAQATEFGASATTPPVHMPGIGRTSVIHDPEGAELGLWEAGGHQGARVIDVTGSIWWIELMARDISAARAFYTALFGWTFIESAKIGFPYTVFRIGELNVAGAAQYDPEWGITPHWHVLFAVEDFPAAVARAAAQGGRLEFWRDVPHNGRFGILTDPGKAGFCIMHPNQVGVPS